MIIHNTDLPDKGGAINRDNYGFAGNKTVPKRKIKKKSRRMAKASRKNNR